jgi:hypothetical protein
MTLKSRIAGWYVRHRLIKAVADMIGRRLTRKEKAMFGRIFGNWQTSLFGMLIGALQLHSGGMTWGNALQAAMMAALGLAAKDAGTGSAPGGK